MVMKMYTWNDGSTLQHHGILGQKWGIRRYQNPDGTLTEAGKKRYGENISKLEKKTIEKNYKENRKNGGHFIFKSARDSTGKNYDKAVKDFEQLVLNDKTYRQLSKKAYDAEMKRIMSEKKYYDPYDSEKYEKYVNTKKYWDMTNDSEKAGNAKDKYVEKMASMYLDTIKEAKLDDMKIHEYRDIAKEYLSNNFYDFVWDENIQYNPDHYYEPGWEDNKFR